MTETVNQEAVDIVKTIFTLVQAVIFLFILRLLRKFFKKWFDDDVNSTNSNEQESTAINASPEETHLDTSQWPEGNDRWRDKEKATTSSSTIPKIEKVVLFENTRNTVDVCGLR